MFVLEQSPKSIRKGSMGFHSVSWPILDKLMVTLVSREDKQLGEWEHSGNSSVLGYCKAWWWRCGHEELDLGKGNV